jgi:hypothetical protein
LPSFSCGVCCRIANHEIFGGALVCSSVVFGVLPDNCMGIYRGCTERTEPVSVIWCVTWEILCHRQHPRGFHKKLGIDRKHCHGCCKWYITGADGAYTQGVSQLWQCLLAVCYTHELPARVSVRCSCAHNLRWRNL